jgi:hypothetical protein
MSDQKDLKQPPNSRTSEKKAIALEEPKKA